MPEAGKHFVHRSGWLRAAVLGANDGVISTASLIAGVAAASPVKSEILTAAYAGWAAGTMAMAAGEYVSVSSQADSERADLLRERKSLEEAPEYETHELEQIYEDRGLTPELAEEVAVQLMAKDALSAHARDELGFSQETAAKPILAAFASAVSFSAGAALPALAALASPSHAIVATVPLVALVVLAGLGATAARLGGAAPLKPALRVALWGALAMAVTAGIGALVGKAL